MLCQTLNTTDDLVSNDERNHLKLSTSLTAHIGLLLFS